jgi:hypothetical protein
VQAAADAFCVQEHFVFNLDEEVALASGSDVVIVGSREKDHHYNASHDSRDVSQSRCLLAFFALDNP